MTGGAAVAPARPVHGLRVIVQAGSVGDRLLDCELTDCGLRFGMERSDRAPARLAGSRSDRIALVDLANDMRPRTPT
jgi:serine/threonine-protein kinase PknG